MKKEDIVKGSNVLTQTIEHILKEYGGTKYQKTTFTHFKEDVDAQFTAAADKATGSLKLQVLATKRKVLKAKDIVDALTKMTDIMFMFSTDVEEN